MQIGNPSYAPGAALEQSLGRLAAAFFSGPSQYEKDALAARTEAARLSADKTRREIATLDAQAAGPQRIADVVRRAMAAPPEAPRPTPGFEGPMPQMDRGAYVRSLVPDLYSAGGGYMNPKELGQLAYQMAQTAGVSPREAASLAPDPLSETQQNALYLSEASPRDQRIGALGQAAYGPSEEQVRAGAFSRLAPNLQAAAVGPSKDEALGTLLFGNFNNLGGLALEQQRVLGAAGSSEGGMRAQRIADVTRQTGVSEGVATGVVDGLIKLTVDEVGRRVLTDVRTGESRLANLAEGEEPPVDTSFSPTVSPGDLNFNAGDAVGLGAAAKNLVNNTVGQFTGTVFPGTEDAAMALKNFRQDMLTAFKSSGRVLAQELQNIYGMSPDAFDPAKNPQLAQENIAAILERAAGALPQLRTEAARRDLPPKERQNAAAAARDIERFLQRYMRPEAAQRALSGAPTGLPSPKSPDERDALPPGTRYLAPDGSERVRE